MQEQIVLVDEQDHVLGSIDKLLAHETGQLHRAFSVFLFSGTLAEPYVLLQQRAMHKYHSAGLWTNTCCSHPRVGEELLAAARRRLQEEMGLTLKLRVCGHFIYRAELANGLIEHELDHVLMAWVASRPLVIPFNPAEVANIAWRSVADLRLALERDMVLPIAERQYTPWLQQALELALSGSVC
jgi:isopentenyl-diphosphate delta-isomerase